MSFPINQFEEYIDENILERGFSYFNNGRVLQVDEISAYVYEAVVQGEQNYTVQLRLENGIIKDSACDYPYDFGPVCKHITAVIFYLQQEELKISPKKQKTQSKKKSSKKRKTKKDQIIELLNSIPHEQLLQFIVEQTTQNRSLRDVFLLHFSQYNPNQSKAFYCKQVKSLVNSVSGSYGMINSVANKQLYSVISGLLNTAATQIEYENYKNALYINFAIMEEMVPALEHSYDSEGHITGCIDEACEMLYTLSKCELPEETRQLVLEYCIDAFDKENFSGWDWHFDMLQIAEQLVKTDTEFESLMRIMDKSQPSEYEEENTQKIKYQLILKIKGSEDANAYLENNLSNYHLRNTAILNAITNEDFIKADKLAKDGIKQDKKSKPGLVRDWYKWLLKIAQLQKDKEKIIEYARYLFLDNYGNEQDYYQILKMHVPSDQWDSYVNQLIKDIKAKSYYWSMSLIPFICIWEKWWDKLFEWVKQYPTLTKLEEFEHYLSKDYSNELIEMYAVEIKGFLKHNVGRTHYIKACKYLKRIKKLDNTDKFNELICYLRKNYANRRALMEELDKII